MKRSAIAAFALAAAAVSAPGQGHYESPYAGYATPHTVWGRPWAAGRLRVLFLIAGREMRNLPNYTQAGALDREAVELVQRFDMTCDTVLTLGSRTGKIEGGPEGSSRLDRLIENDYDVYVLGNVSFDHLRPRLKHAMLKRVVDGAGLVCVGHFPKKVFLEQKVIPRAGERIAFPALARLGYGRRHGAGPGAPAADVDDWLDGIVCAYRVGRGRGVSIVYPDRAFAVTPAMPYSLESRAEYEYWIAWIGKVICWAAGKEGRLHLTADGRVTNRSDARLSADVEIVIKDERGRVLQSDRVGRDLPAGASASLPVAPPEAGNGVYVVELRAESARGREAFSALAVEVSGRPAVRAVLPDASFVEPGGRLTGSVDLDAAPGRLLRLELVDADRRIVARQDVALDSAEPRVRFGFDIDALRAPTIAMRVRASLLESGQLLDSRDAAFSVPHRNREGFKFVLWGKQDDVVSYCAFERLGREAGFNVCVTKGEPGPVLGALNYAQVLYLTRIAARRDAKGRMEPACWNNVEWWQDSLSRMLDEHRAARAHGVMMYSLGDEVDTSGSCTRPECLAAYRAFLGETYGEIGALNASWKSEYGDFGDVDLLVPGDFDENEALASGLYARWYDRQLFSRKTFADLCARFAPVAQRHDPLALTGFEGAGKLKQGPAFEQITGTTGFWVTYSDLASKLIHALTGPEFVRSRWMGYVQDADSLICNAWQTVTHGADGIWWWRWDGQGNWNGLIRSNLEFFPAAEEMFDELAVVRRGLGDLLVRYRLQDDDVVFLYSEAAWAGARLDGHDRFGTIDRVHEGFGAAIRDLGLGFRYITDSMLRDGELKRRGAGVLVMPFATAIGDATAAAISEFVHEGGTVITDIRPAVYDGHCAPRGSPALDKLFGVRQATRAVPIEVADLRLAIGPGREISLGQVVVDASLEVTDARPRATHDGVPLLCERRAGAGRAVLLNAQLGGYIGLRFSDRASGIRELLSGWFSAAGVTPEVAVVRADGRPANGVEKTFWQEGPVRILSLMTAADHGEALTVRIREPGFVYGLNPGRPFGRCDNWRVALPPKRARFFAILPHAVGQPETSIAGPTVAGTPHTVTIRSPGAREGEVFAFHVELVDPKGEPACWSRDVVLGDSGRAAYAWLPAFNDPPGTWSLRVTELFSGGTASADILPANPAANQSE